VRPVYGQVLLELAVYGLYLLVHRMQDFKFGVLVEVQDLDAAVEDQLGEQMAHMHQL
jgi:hypothetical protein